MRLVDRSVIALVGLTFFHGVAAAQESRPCKVIRTLVETERSILLLCDESSPSLPALAELHIAKKGGPGDPHVELEKVTDVKVEDVPEGAPQWKRVVVPASATALTPGNRYFVYVAPSAPPQPPSGTWKPFWQEIKTEFEAAITDSAASIDSGAKLTLTAGVALQPGDGVTLHATTDGRQCQVPAIFTVSRPAPIGPGADPDLIGRVEIVVTGARLPTGKVKLTVNGLKDLFGTPVNTGAKARTEILGRKLSGKTKDEVGTYIKFGHQAGRDTESVWTVDSKVAVELPRRFDDWRVTPTATVDIGFGPSKSSNTIKMGVAFTRFDLVGGTDFEYPRESWSERETAPLQGLRLTVAPTFETDRDFEKRNVLADLDGEFFFDGFYNPIQRQNRRRLDEARRKTPGIEMDEVAGASFGWAITTNLGVEVGRSLDDREKTIETEVGGEKVSTTLVAEAHNIFRLRPRLGVLLEFKRFSFNLQGTGRLLVSEEQALVEADKTFSVQKFDGWHGYGEVTVSVPLSPRTAIDSTWKNGRQPPQFQRINVVQTGLAFRF